MTDGLRTPRICVCGHDIAEHLMTREEDYQCLHRAECHCSGFREVEPEVSDG